MSRVKPPEAKPTVQTYEVTVEVDACSLGEAATKVEDALTLAGVEADCNVIIARLPASDEDEE